MSEQNLSLETLLKWKADVAAVKPIKPMMIRGNPYYVVYKPNPLWLRLRTVAKRMRKSA